MRSCIKEGEGFTTPNDGSRCVIKIKGMEKNGRVFDERDHVEFELGEGSSQNIISGVETALSHMKKGDIAKLAIKAQHAWGISGFPEFNIPASTDVTYEVELKSFEKCKEAWQLNSDEKLEQSTLLKNKGSDLFKDSKYELAMKKYQKISEYLKNEAFDTDEQKEQSLKLQVAGQLNVAACALKLKEYNQAIDACVDVLEKEPKNEKGIFRLAQAYFAQTEFNQAIHYYNLCTEVNPSNKEANHQIAVCKQKLKEYNEKQKAIYSKMFK